MAIRNIYLKIERIPGYSTVEPFEKAPPPIQYRRDCMRNMGHENGLIPAAEVEARSLDALVYREYLDPDYLVPKTDKIINADVNEPVFDRRVPGAVLYAHPGDELHIHVHNDDDMGHSFHIHGVEFGIDSDGSWPFGTQAADGRRSDEICPHESWTYILRVTKESVGAWPFHDHSMHPAEAIDSGLIGGLVVLPPGMPPPTCHWRPPPFHDFHCCHRTLQAKKGKVSRSGKRPAARSHSGSHAHSGPHPEPHDEEPHSGPHPGDHSHSGLCSCGDFPLLKQQYYDWLREWHGSKLTLPCPDEKVIHAPVFFHAMRSSEDRPVFDSGDIEELTGSYERVFDTLGEHEYFCQIHPVMNGTVRVVSGAPMNVTVNIVDAPAMGFSPAIIDVAPGGTVRWENHSQFHHTVTSRAGAAMKTHCINGRGFVGNSPTIVGRSGQKIRWYVFNLDMGAEWHNFHPHAMRWTFAGQTVDVRSMSPAESFVVEAEIPDVMLLPKAIQAIQKRPPRNARKYRLKGDFVFHCHVHHHMMNGMVGLVRAKQEVWLTPAMAKQLEEARGLPLDNGSNSCPDVDMDRCHHHGSGRWEPVTGAPEVAMMHSVLLPSVEKVLYWGYTRVDQSRLWDYSTPAGAYSAPANQPALLPGYDVNSSNLWSAEHAILDTPEGHVLAHGGFSPSAAFRFDPQTLAWTATGPTADPRFYSTTLKLADGRVLTLYGSGSKTIEVYNPATGAWSAPQPLPAAMNMHQYYPWTYLLPDGRLFIAGPHASHRFDWNAPAGFETFPTIAGERSTGGEKGTSVLLALRPPGYGAKVLVAGGDPAPAQSTAELIDLESATPAWSSLPNFSVPRNQQVQSVLLPDGRVFVCGGVAGGANGGPCETFDPRDPAAGWQLGPEMQHPRLYHSSALLLPDGSVLVGGDPMDPATGNPTPHERFYPDYCDMARPAITAAPASVAHGASLTIQTPEAATASEVVLMSPGAVTHGFNMSQRIVECAITGRAGNDLTVATPSNGNVAPPGWYLLFVLDPQRVPSVGRWIRLTP